MKRDTANELILLRSFNKQAPKDEVSAIFALKTYNKAGQKSKYLATSAPNLAIA